MTSPNVNDIEANDNANANNYSNDANYSNNANNANNYSNSNSNSNSAATPSQPIRRRESTIRRVRPLPLLVIDESENDDDALPTGFAPFEIQTFLNFVETINPVLLPISLNNDEI